MHTTSIMQLLYTTVTKAVNNIRAREMAQHFKVFSTKPETPNLSQNTHDRRRKINPKMLSSIPTAALWHTFVHTHTLVRINKCKNKK